MSRLKPLQEGKMNCDGIMDCIIVLYFLVGIAMCQELVYLSEWSNWSTCTPCGSVGSQTKTRRCGHERYICMEQRRACVGPCPELTTTMPTTTIKLTSEPTTTMLTTTTKTKGRNRKKTKKRRRQRKRKNKGRRHKTRDPGAVCEDHALCYRYVYQKRIWCRYHAWVRRRCKVMCGFCPKPIKVTTTPAPTTKMTTTPATTKRRRQKSREQDGLACEDNVHCVRYAYQKDIWCRYDAWIRANCKVMCGYCPNPGCRRMDNATCISQQEYKHYYCQTEWTKRNCPQMCGRCLAPVCVQDDHPSCTMYGSSLLYYCKHGWVRRNCKNMCGYCYKKGPNWPKGEYGVLSRDKCPSGWYEFNHCMDTENDDNQDNIYEFNLRPYYKCDKSSVTFRYCFKGPSVPTVSGGFWVWGGPYCSAYVVRNAIGECGTFGRKGGQILIDNEGKHNKNSFGNDYNEEGLNGRTFSEYSPYSFIYNSSARTQLAFCEVGYPKATKSSKRYMEVGLFNYQKFGFFSPPSSDCPIINSPYGRLIGEKQNFHLDDENYYNQNRVLSGNPPVMIGFDSDWAVCEYDPYKAKRETETT